jgi:stromal membrane-associated protein
MCTNCSGAHRHIGTQFSKVKSTNMDHWSEDQVRFMVTLGNTKANDFWEALLPPDAVRPFETDERHAFVRV